MSEGEELPLEDGSGKETREFADLSMESREFSELPLEYPAEEEYPDFLCQNDEIDRMIEERAGAFNLTGTNIRNILYHVVLGVGGASDLWEADEPDLMSLIELAEPKTRAAKQKLMVQSEGSGSQTGSDPLLTMPEVRSPEHDEDEEEDKDYNPQHDTECSEDSDDERESVATATPRSVRQTPRHGKISECESAPATPSVGLAKRTRSLFSLKDRELVDLELDLPEDADLKEEEDKDTSVLETSIVEVNETEIPENEDDWAGLEKELEEEFDNITEDEESFSSDGSTDAADDGTFSQFLAGITNPKEEFAEEDTKLDAPYMYRERMRFEVEEFRTDKDVTVTKKEMDELYRDLDKSHPDIKNQLRRNRKLSPSEEIVTVQAGPLFTSLSLDILTEQLQMHLQLLVQHTVLAAGSPSLLDNKETAAKRIVELEELYSQTSTEGLIHAMGGTETRKPTVKCLDIYSALRLSKGEKSGEDAVPSQPIPTTLAREVSRIKHIEPLPGNKYQIFNFQPFFQKFLHLRPTVDFICRTKIRPNANRHFTELEDNLLTHGLDAFRFVKEQKVVYELIQEYQLPTKTPKQINIRIKNKSNSSAAYNVIKHWKETGAIRYDTHYTTTILMKSLSVPVDAVSTEHLIAPAIKRENLDWLVALREHRRKLQREYSKRKQRLNCTKEAVLTAAKLSTTDEGHGFEIAFLLKAKEVLKDDDTTYFNVFKTLAEYNQINDFDCEEVIGKIMRVLKNYPDLGFEFLSIFSPLPDMPVDKLLETLSHVKTRILLRDLERHFINSPNQYKKVIKLILGANLCNPAATKDTLLNMLKGKPELSDQVSEYFDKCALKPKANDFEYIDLTDKNTAPPYPVNSDGFEEISLLERKSVSTQKHNKLIESINKHHDEQRKLAEYEKVESKRLAEEEKRFRRLEKRKMPARNVVECGDTVLTWTIDQDREILRLCRTSGARYKTFKILSKSFSDKTDTQVRDRFRTLMELMKKSQKAAERKAKASAIKRRADRKALKQGISDDRLSIQRTDAKTSAAKQGTENKTSVVEEGTDTKTSAAEQEENKKPVAKKRASSERRNLKVNSSASAKRARTISDNPGSSSELRGS